MSPFNRLQLIKTGFWTVLKYFWNSATDNQNSPKFGQLQLKNRLDHGPVQFSPTVFVVLWTEPLNTTWLCYPFDKAVCQHVGAHWDLELTDFNKFFDLESTHMDSICVAGIQHASAATTNKPSGTSHKKLPEPCNCWNKGLCMLESTQCHWLHVCSKCLLSGHKNNDCSSKQWSSSMPIVGWFPFCNLTIFKPPWFMLGATKKWLASHVALANLKESHGH